MNHAAPISDKIEADYWKAADKAVLEVYKGYDGSVLPAVCNCCWLPFYPWGEGVKAMTGAHCVSCFYDVENDVYTPMSPPKVEEIIGGDDDHQL